MESAIKCQFTHMPSGCLYPECLCVELADKLPPPMWVPMELEPLYPWPPF